MAKSKQTLKKLSNQFQRAALLILDGLEVTRMGRFIALVPIGDQSELAVLAAMTVKDLDPFRAPPSAEELAKRRPKLSPAQERNLAAWGHPYVMDQFRFHITLTGRIKGDIMPAMNAVRSHFAPCLEKPFEVNSLTLAGQDASGFFHAIMRCSLGTEKAENIDNQINAMRRVFKTIKM